VNGSASVMPRNAGPATKGCIRAYIAKLDPAISGQRGHDATFKAACALVWRFGLSPEEAWPYALEYNSRCIPPWSEHDLRRKLLQALGHPGHQKPRGYLLGGEAYRFIAANSASLPRPAAGWPAPDMDAIDATVVDGPGLYDLWERSPIRFDDGDGHTEELIDTLLPGNPLLCCARSGQIFATRRREVWRGKLATLPLLVPNPMVSVLGQTQDGRPSEHTKSATAKRVYQVIEFDFSEKDKNGAETIWAPFIRKWTKAGITVADACAALILHLAERMPTLASVCFSGGKSLHAWFRVLELDSSQQREFMRYAVSLGADPATWNKAQLVRIPDGLRPGGVPQTGYYLNPQEAVRL
jgi:hypothetical protein